MAIKDIFLPLVGEPDAGAIAAIDKCMAVAGNLGARVSTVAVEEDILARPKVMISDDLDNTAALEAVRSVSGAHELLKAFDSAAIRFGVRNEQTLSRLAVADIPGNFATYARLKDLSLVPVKTGDGRSEKIIEGLIFEVGQADPDVSRRVRRRIARGVRRCRDSLGSYGAGRTGCGRCAADSSVRGQRPNYHCN